MPAFQFVTKAMVPDRLWLAPDQERAFLERSAEFHQVPPEQLERVVAVELPDTFVAWEYSAAHVVASASRGDLAPAMLTPEDMWRDRPQQLAQISLCLMNGEPPAVAFMCFAVKKLTEGS